MKTYDQEAKIITSENDQAQMRDSDFETNIVFMIDQIIMQLSHGVTSSMYEAKDEKKFLTFMMLENIFGKEDEILVIMKDVSEV